MVVKNFEFKDFDVNCADIVYEGGILKVVYEDDDMVKPLVLIQTNSYSDLNEKAMKFFGDYEWTAFIYHLYFDNSTENFSDDAVSGLVLVKTLSDIYANHFELFEEVDAAFKKHCQDVENEDDPCTGCEFDGLCDSPCCEECCSDEECDVPVSDSEVQNPYEYVDKPNHYGGLECIENMRRLYGDDAVRWFCICNAYKYRFRKGKKPGTSMSQDEEKAAWYEDYAVKMMDEKTFY